MITTLTQPWSSLTERDKGIAFAEAFKTEVCYLTLGHVMDVAESRFDEIWFFRLNSGDWGARIMNSNRDFFTGTSKTIPDALAQALMKTI